MVGIPDAARLDGFGAAIELPAPPCFFVSIITVSGDRNEGARPNGSRF